MHTKFTQIYTNAQIHTWTELARQLASELGPSSNLLILDRANSLIARSTNKRIVSERVMIDPRATSFFATPKCNQRV